MSQRRTLPILDNLDDIRIASPCNADWDRMAPVDSEEGARARFCGSCEKNVYDLSSMTRPAALALIERHEGHCCVRFYKRTDGTVLTEDCPVGFQAALRRAQLRTVAGIASCAGAIASVVAFLLGTANPLSRALGTFEEAHRPIAGGMMVQSPPAPEPEVLEAVQGGVTEESLAPPPRPVVKMGKVAAPRR